MAQCSHKWQRRGAHGYEEKRHARKFGRFIQRQTFLGTYITGRIRILLIYLLIIIVYYIIVHVDI